jgi:DNA-directed RNA polymerase specialized sigma24 family protein
MHERADRLAGSFVTVDHELEHEFETRLVESSTLAYRVAFSVLRQRGDAEDVAQEPSPRRIAASDSCATATDSGHGWCG